MTEPAKRPWFTFSLRTLFILLTVFSVWLGWQINIVRERSHARQEFDSKFDFTTAEAYAATYAGTPPDALASISWSRRWLGDEAVQQIWYRPWNGGPTAEDIAHVTKVFPEATVSEVPMEPCHPGCFPRGTRVETPDGLRRIEEIALGDLVISLAPDGTSTAIAVQKIFTTDNHLWRVETELGELITTETQPLCTGVDATCQAGKLKPGDTLLFHNDGAIEPVLVKKVSRTRRTEQVINLILGDSQIFVAGGYLARSKPPAHAVAAKE